MELEWKCATCGATHVGVPLSWGFDEPVYWSGLSDEERADGHLDTDLCRFADGEGEAHFVRGTMEIPILDATDPEEELFVIGVWASLSETNFGWLVDHWTAGPDEQGEPWFGWLSNRIPVYEDTLNLKTDVHLRGEGLRPLIEVQPSDHPLARDQHEGITLLRAYDLGQRWFHL